MDLCGAHDQSRRTQAHTSLPFRLLISNHKIQLCGFCHALGFFFRRHSGERFSWSHVADLLQQSGGGCMQVANDQLAIDQNRIRAVKSLVVKRSILIAGHKTSVSLEDAFWTGLKEIASERRLTLSDMVSTIDSERRQGNLSSAIRLFVLDFYRRQVSELKTGGHRQPWQTDSPEPFSPARAQASMLRLVDPDPGTG
jgi:predicted DNA-binding ribbon-helix-helix protein